VKALRFELLTNPTTIEDVKQNSIKYCITNGILQFSSDIKKETLLDISGKNNQNNNLIWSFLYRCPPCHFFNLIIAKLSTYFGIAPNTN